MTMLQGPHQPLRPSWDCRECGLPWPCAAGRDWLLRAYGRTSALAKLMHALMEEAIPELPAGTRGDLWGRFIAWTKPPELSPADVALSNRRPGSTTGKVSHA